MVTKFETFLTKQNLSKNTVSAYLWTVNYYLNHYGEIKKKNLLAYKGYLVDNYKPQTVNLRLLGLNKYLEFIKMDKYKLKLVKMQQKNFLERHNDIALLADLMGHESIETTRIYLRRTSTEQQQLVDKIVNW